MKKLIAGLLALIMILSMMLAVTSCKKKDEAAPETQTEEGSDATEEAAEDLAEVVKTLEPDAEDEIGNDLPLEIESAILYKDGSIRIIPTGDLKKNELGDSEADSIMPFAESGEAKDIYLLRLGNGGYRTILALMDDGTVSAVNAMVLIEDHIAVVMDNLGGRDSFVGLEQGESEEGFTIIGKTKEGDEVLLDPIILSDQARGEPEDEEN